ncbi:DNA-processing protein DprA [Streptomyces sp. 549]|uniref:DNA-processing protein DprA n=1 Tax=Streptomyces sp. 549 TaxID=3049076 RepID=UPI0024C46764|nr:DNA-processing protein DprA [Streptomyces sp. 549]MDK1475111.1 DNA-processing protein DprA [Streptomyces sp. 549]
MSGRGPAGAGGGGEGVSGGSARHGGGVRGDGTQGGGPGDGGAGCAEEDRLARAALCRVGEPGETAIGRWLATLGPGGTLSALLSGRPLPGVSAERLIGLRARARAVRPQKDLAALADVGGRFLVPGDREWPGQLDDLGEARPVGLWVRGPASLRLCALRSVAVVGARACTDYGAHVASVLGAELAEHGWAVASGAAYGVDAAAHRGALAVDGATIAVLACGVDRAYPPGNQELIARIAERGVLVAELPPGAHPTRSRFVLRNRVIAALTRGTVVVEAQLRSGSLVTARRAGELGRYVMGVPGPVTSRLSAGVHQLLRAEGVPVGGAGEIVELVGDIGELAPGPEGTAVPRDLLHPLAARLLDALPAAGSVPVGWLAQAAGTATAVALPRLRELRALGFVECRADRWQLAHSSGRHPNR